VIGIVLATGFGTLIGIARLFDDRISIEIDAIAIPSS